MEASVMGDLARQFDRLNDGRRPNRRHPLVSVITIAVVAVLCNADGWAAVARFAQEERRWLELFVPLPCGVPSRQTFQRVFSLLKPAEVEKCLTEWFRLMEQYTQGALKHVAIDGKALERPRGSGSLTAEVHLTPLWFPQLI